MTKERYLQHLKSGMFDVHVFYQYYSEFNTRNEYKFGLEEFNHLFSMYLQMVGYHNVVNTVMSYYSRKFNVYEVKDKMGKIIGYY